ncbi:MAG: hypothetical protein ACI9MS_000942 [Glaciecola sp.]|jgi:hypothetical protein
MNYTYRALLKLSEVYIIMFNTKAFKKFFKRKYPYSPVAILGRKTVERILGADIIKLKKLEEKQKQERDEQREA